MKLQSPLRDLPREVSVLVIASFFVAVGFGIIVPAIPLFARSFGVSNAAVGLIISLFALSRFASGLVSGRLVDKFGERTVFAVGVAFVALSVGLSGLAQSYNQLLFFRAAGGLGSSMFSVAASSVILRSVSDAQRGHAQSVYNGSFLLGAIAGPAIGGALAAISLRAPFFVYAVSLSISGTVAFIFFTSEHLQAPKKSEGKKSAMSLKDALALKGYRYALVITFVTSWVLFGVRTSILPLFITEQLKSTAAVVGWGFTLSAVIQGTLILRAGRLSDERGRRFILIVGTTIAMVGIIIMTLTLNPLMFLICMAILGLGNAFLASAPATIVGDLIEGKGGQVIALFQMAGDAGMIVGPVVVGFIADHYGYRAAFGLSGLVFCVEIVLAMKMPETRKSRAPQAVIDLQS
ncbi:MAG: MFS transporter [Candidatus Planktophila sp.]